MWTARDTPPFVCAETCARLLGCRIRAIFPEEEVLGMSNDVLVKKYSFSSLDDTSMGVD